MQCSDGGDQTGADVAIEMDSAMDSVFGDGHWDRYWCPCTCRDLKWTVPFFVESDIDADMGGSTALWHRSWC